MPATPWMPAPELVLTMAPRFAVCSMAGGWYFLPSHTPVRLTAMMRSHRSRVHSTTPPVMGEMPALLWAASRRPKLETTADTSSATSLSLETSQSKNFAAPGTSVSISATVSRPLSPLVSTTATAAPARANPSADARPIPLPAPVTSATLPAYSCVSTTTSPTESIDLTGYRTGPFRRQGDCEARQPVREFETIQVEIKDGVCWLTLNRPDRLNAFTTTMQQEVREVWRHMRVDD